MADSDEELDLMLLALLIMKKKNKRKRKRKMWVKQIYRERHLLGINRLAREMQLTTRETYFK